MVRDASLSDLLSPSTLLGLVDLALRLDDDSDLSSNNDDDDVICFLMKLLYFGRLSRPLDSPLLF